MFMRGYRGRPRHRVRPLQEDVVLITRTVRNVRATPPRQTPARRTLLSTAVLASYSDAWTVTCSNGLTRLADTTSTFKEYTQSIHQQQPSTTSSTDQGHVSIIHATVSGELYKLANRPPNRKL
ncbi:hypothetical protein J3459_003995 [Metarhizium acridum]|uniref:uncharacterized protein n=1 Tax=Metarhizium acridum TaxID=92637 RepID=UPI001C6C745C|nr:hypothetical protein J3458_002781 [Metarhizium acridum]KAG8428362.1 hypothetical protein J3459_003995 [Metarhizium acridum]